MAKHGEARRATVVDQDRYDHGEEGRVDDHAGPAAGADRALGDGEHVNDRERGVQEGVGGQARPIRQRYAAERRRVILIRGPVAGT